MRSKLCKVTIVSRSGLLLMTKSVTRPTVSSSCRTLSSNKAASTARNALTSLSVSSTVTRLLPLADQTDCNRLRQLADDLLDLAAQDGRGERHVLVFVVARLRGFLFLLSVVVAGLLV